MIVKATRCPKKNRCLINNKTKLYCVIFKIPSILNKIYVDIDFGIKIVEIR